MECGSGASSGPTLRSAPHRSCSPNGRAGENVDQADHRHNTRTSHSAASDATIAHPPGNDTGIKPQSQFAINEASAAPTLPKGGDPDASLPILGAWRGGVGGGCG